MMRPPMHALPTTRTTVRLPCWTTGRLCAIVWSPLEHILMSLPKAATMSHRTRVKNIIKQRHVTLATQSLSAACVALEIQNPAVTMALFFPCSFFSFLCLLL